MQYRDATKGENIYEGKMDGSRTFPMQQQSSSQNHFVNIFPIHLSSASIL
jgi:hypothetical protein